MSNFLANRLGVTGWLSLAIFLMQCSAPPEKRMPKTDTVEIKGMRFQPDRLTIQPGDSVIWINHDLVDHDITSTGGESWNSGPLHPGKSWSRIFPGGAEYYCSIHPVMKGKLVTGP
jgi:plastocyanin